MSLAADPVVRIGSRDSRQGESSELASWSRRSSGARNKRERPVRNLVADVGQKNRPFSFIEFLQPLIAQLQRRAGCAAGHVRGKVRKRSRPLGSLPH